MDDDSPTLCNEPSAGTEGVEKPSAMDFVSALCINTGIVGELDENIEGPVKTLCVGVVSRAAEYDGGGLLDRASTEGSNESTMAKLPLVDHISFPTMHPRRQWGRPKSTENAAVVW